MRLRTSVLALSVLTAVCAPALFAHDEYLGALAPVCVVDSTKPFGDSEDLARIVTLEADLSNLAENPAILDRNATGTFRVVIRLERASAATSTPSRGVVNATFRFAAGQDETITASHIHMAPAGTNGNVVLPLNPDARFDLAAGQPGVIQQQFEVTDQVGLQTLLDIADSPEKFYANVHSTAKPGGLLRGQLRNAASDNEFCFRTALGALSDQIGDLGTDVSELGAAAGVVTTGFASLQSDIAAIKTSLAGLQAAGGGASSATLNAILRLVVLTASQEGVIGANERDQLLKMIQ